AGTDPDNDPLQFFLDDPHPAGMTISATGMVQWTPTQAQFGPTHPVTVHVEDGRGGASPPQTFNIDVTSTTINHAPHITSTPKLVAVANEEYAYDAKATDQDNDPLAW